MCGFEPQGLVLRQLALVPDTSSKPCAVCIKSDARWSAMASAASLDSLQQRLARSEASVMAWARRRASTRVIGRSLRHETAGALQREFMCMNSIGISQKTSWTQFLEQRVGDLASDAMMRIAAITGQRT